MKIEEKKLRESLTYLINFMLRNEELAEWVHYMKERQARDDCSGKKGHLYIIESSFFYEDHYGEKGSLPVLPLPEYENIPFFYGMARDETVDGNLFLYADIVASAYFVVTRYEEMVRADVRDIYGNFPARESILVRENLLYSPMIDKYGELLSEKLVSLGHDVPVTPKGFERLYFTHDIDIPFQTYSFTHMAKTIGRELLGEHRMIFHPLMNYLGFYGMNPRKTWDYMLKKERQIGEETGILTESICFIIATDTSDRYTSSYIYDKKIKPVLTEMESLGSGLGLHTSYEGASDSAKIKKEKETLETVSGHEIRYQRNHYLRQMDPSDIGKYEAAGFMDDFTTGFNEMPGFRLGTCHPVRWINPKTGELSGILLHGLQIMDGSVIGKKPYQMELSYEEAKKLCGKILDEVYRYRGEICILWHNGVFDRTRGNYLKELYDWILAYILEISGNRQEENG